MLAGDDTGDASLEPTHSQWGGPVDPASACPNILASWRRLLLVAAALTSCGRRHVDPGGSWITNGAHDPSGESLVVTLPHSGAVRICVASGEPRCADLAMPSFFYRTAFPVGRDAIVLVGVDSRHSKILIFDETMTLTSEFKIPIIDASMSNPQCGLWSLEGGTRVTAVIGRFGDRLCVGEQVVLEQVSPANAIDLLALDCHQWMLLQDGSVYSISPLVRIAEGSDWLEEGEVPWRLRGELGAEFVGLYALAVTAGDSVRETLLASEPIRAPGVGGPARANRAECLRSEP